MTDVVLRTIGLTKRFGSVKALSDVDFSLEKGEIHALLGVNGAGKSTFIKILSGVYSKTSGDIEINGTPVTFQGPRDAIDHGIATVQQHPELIPDLDGYQNIFLGREGTKPGLLSRINHTELRRRGDALLARFPVEIDLSRPVGALSAVEREIVAILQALSHSDIRVMILDEPTSTLTELEKGVLFRVMATLKAAGIAIIYITHRLEEVVELADRFTVFRGGCRIATMNASEVQAKSLSLAELMLGEALDHIYPPKRSAPAVGAPAFEVRGLKVTGAIENVTLDVRHGEIVGVFGLVGSGLDELSKAVFGAEHVAAGEIRVSDRLVAPRSPREALKAGIFLVPGDRRAEGLTLSQNSIFNIKLAALDRASGPLGLLKRGANRRHAKDLATTVALSPPNLDLPVSGFSGGNQQKIVVAKGLFTEAQVYIFVEPTIGVDIGARSRLYALMRELAERAAVIVMSTDCDEVYGLSDRCFALYKGRQIGAPSPTTTRNELLTAGIMGRIQ